MVGLATHTIFEGLVLGISKSNTTRTNIFVAIVLHKWAVAASLGINFRRLKITTCKSIVLMCIFACIAPLGVLIGALLQDLESIYSGIFGAISAGTLLYISPTEIIAEEFEYTNRRWRKYFCYLGGIALIVFLKVLEVVHVLEGHEH